MATRKRRRICRGL